MTTYTVTVIPRKDLQAITLICADCKTRMTIRFDAQLIERCASCNREFDKGAQNAQVQFNNFHQSLNASKIGVEFQVTTSASATS